MRKNVLKKWMYDLILSICILVVVVIAVIYSYILQSPRVDLFLARPDTYMGMWFIILALLAFMLLARALKMRKTPEGQEPGDPIWCTQGAYTALVLFLYLLTLERLGFILGSTLMLWALTLVYTFSLGAVKKDWRNRKLFFKELAKSGAFSLASSLVTYIGPYVPLLTTYPQPVRPRIPRLCCKISCLP